MTLSKQHIGLISLYFIFCLAGCSRVNGEKDSDSEIALPGEVVEAVFDSTALAKDTLQTPLEEKFTVEDGQDIKTAELEFMRNSPDADKYMSGIMPVIARETPKYAAKLLNNSYDGFIVVDKASLRVLLYDKFGREQRAYDMACAKNYGTKHKRADSRTPEGFFSVEGIYNSTDWLFTDDEGNTSPKKGQFGPRFIRIKTPVTSQVGIHGTCAPWSIGSRSSHGCIRIKNEQILELVELVTPGMPVIINPGKRDRRVNREEGYDIPYFPTAPKYAMTEAEKKLSPGPEMKDNLETDSIAHVRDSVEVDSQVLSNADSDSEKAAENAADSVIRTESGDSIPVSD